MISGAGENFTKHQLASVCRPNVASMWQSSIGLKDEKCTSFWNGVCVPCYWRNVGAFIAEQNDKWVKRSFSPLCGRPQTHISLHWSRPMSIYNNNLPRSPVGRRRLSGFEIGFPDRKRYAWRLRSPNKATFWSWHSACNTYALVGCHQSGQISPSVCSVWLPLSARYRRHTITQQ